MEGPTAAWRWRYVIPSSTPGRVRGRPVVAAVDLPRAGGHREDARSERGRPVEVGLLDVTRGDRFDAALFGAAAPADGVRLQMRGLVAEGQGVASRRQPDLLGLGGSDVEREPGGVARRGLARNVGVSETRVVSRDAVAPAVRKPAVQPELRARERAGRRLRADIRDRLELSGQDAVELDSLLGRRRGVGALLDRELAQHVGGQPVAKVPDRGRRRRRLRAGGSALAGQRDRDRRDLLQRRLMPQPLQGGFEPALVGDEVVDADGRRGQDERPVRRRARAVERAVGQVVEDDEHARDGSLEVTHDTGDRRRGRRAGKAPSRLPSSSNTIQSAVAIRRLVIRRARGSNSGV